MPIFTEDVIDELKAVLGKVLSGDLVRTEIEKSDLKIKIYKVGDVTRIDIKERKEK